jgi:hypothetical protein
MSDHLPGPCALGGGEAEALEAVIEPAGEALSPVMRRHHFWMFWIAVAAIVLAFVLQVLPDQEHVAVRGLGRLVLPGTCLSKDLFHHDCPGCGLTRSVIYFAHMDWSDSWKLHRLGWLMAILIVSQLPYRALCMYRGRAILGRRIPKVLGYIVIALLIGNWLVSFAHR